MKIDGFKKTKYLDFVLVHDTGKTQVYHIVSRSGTRLAIIKWYGAWRQYVFTPETQTIWNAECLEDIVSFVRRLMSDRVKEK